MESCAGIFTDYGMKRNARLVAWGCCILFAIVTAVDSVPILSLRCDVIMNGYPFAQIVDNTAPNTSSRPEPQRPNIMHSWIVLSNGTIVGVGTRNGDFVQASEFHENRLLALTSNRSRIIRHRIAHYAIVVAIASIAMSWVVNIFRAKRK